MIVKPFFYSYFENDDEEAEEEDNRRRNRGRHDDRNRSDHNQYNNHSSSKHYGKKSNDEEEEEEDPLDAFMSNIDKEAKKAVGDSKAKEKAVVEKGDFESGGQCGRDDIDQEDMLEGAMK